VNILFTILNWGLGHAVRCIALIDYLESKGHTIFIASDGIALDFLKKEYPNINISKLPPYDIKYKYKFMPFNIIEKAPRLIKTLIQEHQTVKKIVKEKGIDLVINDNRLACYSKAVPSIFITHQLNVPVPNQSLRRFTNFGHHYFMNKHNYCWIPDLQGSENLAGEISTTNYKTPPKQFIGPITTLNFDSNKESIPLLVVLSGPEPQRSILEKKVIDQSDSIPHEITLVRGSNKPRAFQSQNHRLKILDLVERSELEILLQSAQRIICRSGYTSLMDFYLNPKPLYLIPTPGQWEQEHLAEHWQLKMGVPFSNQKNFNLKQAFEEARMPNTKHKESIFEIEVDKLLEQINPKSLTSY
jgi:uncharacterized protein (TIGR00661 family)